MENKHAYLVAKYAKYQKIWIYVALTISTLGLYTCYWLYQNWRHLQERYSLDISAIGRSLLSVFYIHDLVARINDMNIEKGGNAIKMDIYLVFYILTLIVNRIFNRIDGAENYWFLLIFLMPGFFLIPVVKQLNEFWIIETDGEISPQSHIGEKIIIGIASLLALLIFLGGVLPKETEPIMPIRATNDTLHIKYFEEWQTFETKLLKKGPAPESEEKIEPIDDVIEVVSYPSNGLSLKAYLYKGEVNKSSKKPAIVIFHGGHSASAGYVQACMPFIRAGFVVLAPALRGENGNPGNCELMKGEVDDAKAAIKWLSAQPYIDKNEIYAFGHSLGGGVALALSLHPDVPVRFIGSNAGVFNVSFFSDFGRYVPFDPQNEKECLMRCPVYFLRQMQGKHYLYIGKDDNFDIITGMIYNLYPKQDTKLSITQVEGDHFSSLVPSIEAFFEVVREK